MLRDRLRVGETRGEEKLTLLEAAGLGIVQGLTEFLPVSSSGHLVLAEAILGVKQQGAGFEVFAHFGTLLAILLYYRRDLLDMTVSVVRLRRDEHLRLFSLICLGSIPIVIVGLFFRHRIEGAFDDPRIAAGMLLVTGSFLLATRFARRGERRVGPGRAVLIGIAQCIALLPGISRSGSTISTGMFLGVDRDQAARFSFLLVIPALVAAVALKVLEGVPGGSVAAYATGAATAFVSGYLALVWLIRIVSRGRLDRFGWYCLAVGAAALALLARSQV
jgi:undecaprenyl-diphosphatase